MTRVVHERRLGRDRTILIALVAVLVALVMLPALVFSILVRKSLVRGLTAGAIKE